ncbi:MAG: hypothetical protein QXL17_02805 [Candidatus Thermoplasmatota archaeon]
MSPPAATASLLLAKKVLPSAVKDAIVCIKNNLSIDLDDDNLIAVLKDEVQQLLWCKNTSLNI